jgi:invasion protein IalB
MSNSLRFRPLVLALGLALSGAAAFAQETVPATGQPSPDAGLSMGETTGPKTQETAAVGEMYLASEFEQWQLRCMKTEDGSDPCELYQLLKDETGNPVAEISIFPLPAGGKAVSGATIIVPLETLLTANLALTIDTAQPKIYPYTTCGQIGCVARVGFTADEVTQFKKGAKAVLTLVPFAAPDKKINLDISLKGFTAGYDAVVATLKAPAN